MAQHTVTITDLPKLELAHADVRFVVVDEAAGKMGTLLISKGGIEWRPTYKHQRRVSWREFDTLMRRHWGDKRT